MNDRLLKIAKYLGQNGLYKEAAQLQKLASVWQTDEGDSEEGTESPEQRLTDLLRAAAKVREKYKGKTPEEVMEALGFSKDSEDYNDLLGVLENLMGDFYKPQLGRRRDDDLIED